VDAPKYGLQPDGSVLADYDNDYSLQYFDEVVTKECYRDEPPKRVTGDRPWIESESWQHSFAERYTHYRTQGFGYIDLSNPLIVDAEADLRKDNVKVKKKKGVSKIKDFTVTKEGITDVDECKKDNDKDTNEEEEEDFLDEYGNIREAVSEAEDQSSGSDQHRTEGSEKGESKSKRKNKKRKNQKQRKNEKALREQGAHLHKWLDMDGQQETSGTKEMVKSPPPSGRQSLQSVEGISPLLQNWHMEEPRESSLNAYEQKKYVDLLGQEQRIRRDGRVFSLSEQDRRNQDQLADLKNFVLAEQEEFQEFAKDVLAKQSPAMLPPDAKRFLDARCQGQLERVRKEMPRMWAPWTGQQQDSMARLVPPVATDVAPKPQFEMRPGRLLAEMGVVQKALVPSWNRLQQRPWLRVPVRHDRLQVKDEEKKIPNVSRDANVQILAEKYLPDVIVSVSSLKTIFDNFGPRYERAWDIPVVVKEVNARRVVYIDKPVLIRGLTYRDKMELFYKLSAKAFLVHPWTQSRPIRAPIGPRGMERPLAKSAEEDGLFAASIGELESFGMGQVDGAFDDSDSDDNQLVIADAPAEGNVEVKQEVPGNSSDRRGRGRGRGNGSSSKPPAATTRMTRSRAKLTSPESEKRSTRQTKDRSSPPVDGGAIAKPKRGRPPKKAQIVEEPPKVKEDKQREGRTPRSRMSSGESDSLSSGRNSPAIVKGGGKKRGLILSSSDSEKSETSNCSNGKMEVEVSKDKAIDQNCEKQEKQGKQTGQEQNDNKKIQSPLKKAILEKVASKESERNKDTEEAVASMSVILEEADTQGQKEAEATIEDAEVAGTMEKLTVEANTQGEASKENLGLLGGIMAAQKGTFRKEKLAGDWKKWERGALYSGERINTFDEGLKGEEFVQPAEEKNVNYRLWNLWNKANPVQSNLNVLVRCSVHGILRYFN